MPKFDTDFSDGIEFRYLHFFDILQYFAQIGGGEIRNCLFERYRISPPTLFAQIGGGEIRYRFFERYRISPPTLFAQIGGGEIRDRFFERYRISPPTLFRYFAIFCTNRWWRNSRPFRTDSNFTTESFLIFCKILSKSVVAKFDTVRKNGIEFRHHQFGQNIAKCEKVFRHEMRHL